MEDGAQARYKEKSGNIHAKWSHPSIRGRKFTGEVNGLRYLRQVGVIFRQINAELKTKNSFSLITHDIIWYFLIEYGVIK